MGTEKSPAMKSVTIVGFGETSLYFHPREKEYRKLGPVWTINNAHAVLNIKTDRIIAMDDLARDYVEHSKYVNDIVNDGAEVVTSTVYDMWPTTRRYPIEGVLKTLDLPGFLGCRVLTNTCCYAIALAMHEGFRHMDLLGFEFTEKDNLHKVVKNSKKLRDHEPDWFVFYKKDLLRIPTEPGLDGVNYLLGYMHAKGISRRTPQGSTLMDSDRPMFFYGYQEQPDIDMFRNPSTGARYATVPEKEG